MKPRSIAFLILLGSLVCPAGAGTPDGFPQIGRLYVVNSTGDGDQVGSVNFCDDGTGRCTLRAAIQASNLSPGDDGIDFAIPVTDPNYNPATGRATIKLQRALPAITASVSIENSDPSKLTVTRESAASFRIFTVTSTVPVAISGLTMTNGVADIFVDGFGGAIKNTLSGTLTLNNCVITNSFASEAGGIDNKSNGIVNVTNTTISGCGADLCGGILNESVGIVNVTDSFVTVNRSNRFGGGGVYNAGGGTVNITDSTIANNESGNRGGGGLKNEGGGTMTVTRSAIVNNFDDFANGGGIYNAASTLNLIDSTVAGNTGGGGGGIYNTANGLVVIKRSTVNGNNSISDSESGGGLQNLGTAQIENSTFTANAGLSSGAGIANSGVLFVTNSTIAGNVSTGTSHSSGDGAGIDSFAVSPVTIKNTIVALNIGPASSPDVRGSFASSGFNLIGKIGSVTGFTASTDQKGTLAAPLDPRFDPAGLADNGGPTRTIKLLFGSPAVDKGSKAGLLGTLTVDQRGTGFVRTFDDPAVANASGGDGTDVGAYELQTGPPSILGNISTRARVQTGDNVLIGGFIVTGTQPKKVIVRATGPSLNLAGKLANPTLELHGPNGLIASNDNWMDAPNRQEIIDSTVKPANNLESAILTTLPANRAGYTAIVRGVNGGTGIGLVEIFDLDRNVDSRLANISSRSLVQTGDNIMIGGFIISGSQNKKVIVRAIGPSLGVVGKMADPTLELHNRDGVLIASNDDWRTGGQQAEIIASTVPPTKDLESAIVATLPPTPHTAIVRGKNNTTGIALVEVYALN